MTSGFDLSNLNTNIQSHSDYIDQTLSLIPAKYYFKNELREEDSDADQNIRPQPNKRKRKDQQALKEKRQRTKRLKLDPKNLKTVTDIQQEKLIKRRLAQQLNGQADNDHPPALTDKIDNNDEKNFASEKPRKAPGNKIITVAERLVKFRAAKKSVMATNSTSEEVEKKQTGKKVKPKQKPNKNKINNKNHVDKKGLENFGSKTKSSNSNTDADATDKGSDQKSSKGDQMIIFNKLNFDDDTKKPKKKISEVQMLNKLETKKKKVDKVKQVDPIKAEKIEEKETWQKLIQKARGEKVKDDPKLLNKTIKHNQQKKKKSEKAWKERAENVEKNKMERQAKRMENIKARAEAKKKRKVRLLK
ncbi:7721_t:CDS:2 [Paraglomus occultum]|uniref:7721_t:CDS:1 n=1 Tax=Paraglomus occultum TaxID=144539 RepID=A0A9N8W561_9GLOM|nr:7721_t:CDS:2 [Paraglomus occultum]